MSTNKQNFHGSGVSQKHSKSARMEGKQNSQKNRSENDMPTWALQLLREFKDLKEKMVKQDISTDYETRYKVSDCCYQLVTI